MERVSVLDVAVSTPRRAPDACRGLWGFCPRPLWSVAYPHSFMMIPMARQLVVALQQLTSYYMAVVGLLNEEANTVLGMSIQRGSQGTLYL